MGSNEANPAGPPEDGTRGSTRGSARESARESIVAGGGATSGAADRVAGTVSSATTVHHPTDDRAVVPGVERATDRSADRPDDRAEHGKHDPSDANHPADGSVDGAMTGTTDGGHGSGGTLGGTLGRTTGPARGPAPLPPPAQTPVPGTTDGQGQWQPGRPYEPYRDADVDPDAYLGDEQPGVDDDEEWLDEYTDQALLAAIFSAPSLALAAFVFALTGLLGGMIPQSLPYLVQIDPSSGPAYHVRVVGMVALGFAIVAASLGLAAMLRSIGSPLRWPRYLGGAAVLLALLIALQSVLLIALAGISSSQGALN